MQPSDKHVCVFAQKQAQIGRHLFFGPFVRHHDHHVVGQLVVDIAGCAGAQFDEFGFDSTLKIIHARVCVWMRKMNGIGIRPEKH